MSTDKIKSEIELILTKNIEDITLIFLSNILEKKSKLRSLFEKDKNLFVRQFTKMITVYY